MPAKACAAAGCDCGLIKFFVYRICAWTEFVVFGLAGASLIRNRNLKCNIRQNLGQKRIEISPCRLTNLVNVFNFNERYPLNVFCGKMLLRSSITVKVAGSLNYQVWSVQKDLKRIYLRYNSRNAFSFFICLLDFILIDQSS